MNLSKNFTLYELTYSITAENCKIKNIPSNEVAENLKALCEKVLQPLRDNLKCPVIVTSGYRSAELNKKLGGVKNSQHLKGQAADIIVPSKKLSNVFEYIKTHLPFDQLILENNAKNERWIHISYVKDGTNRNMAIPNFNQVKVVVA